MSYFAIIFFASFLQILLNFLFFIPQAKAEDTQDMSQPMRDIPSVSQLSEIQVTDWNFQALEYFLNRYQIKTKYPPEFFQRQGKIKRYEFTFLLNEVIQHIDKLQESQKSNFATQEELQILKRLQSEFSIELNLLEKQIDALEKNSFSAFSTTSRLSGEVTFALTGVGKGTKIDDDEPIDSNIIFGSGVKIEINTSFTGKDRLKTTFRARNLESLDSVTGTDMARLAYQGDNEIFDLGDLTYRFRLGDKARIEIGASGLDIDNFTDSINPYIGSDDSGSVSRFAQRNPIYRQGGGAGIGVKYEINDDLELGMGYVADDVEEPETGLSKADYAAIAQLTFEPSERLLIGVNYIHSFNSTDTNTGSKGSNDPFDDESEAIKADSFGLQASLGISKTLLLGGWIGYTRATAKDLPNNPSASVFNWALTLALPDLGSQGNLGGIIIGQPPKLIKNQYQIDNQDYIDKDTSLHLEAFYRFQVDDNISITPGVILITNPEHNNDNDTIFVGTVRTTFNF
ncbi:MAG: iron uptake porin [Cyanobacteria bacterium P01_C01_bin.38]